MRPFDIEPNYYEELMLSRNMGSSTKKERKDGIESVMGHDDSN